MISWPGQPRVAIAQYPRQNPPLLPAYQGAHSPSALTWPPRPGLGSHARQAPLRASLPGVRGGAGAVPQPEPPRPPAHPAFPTPGDYYLSRCPPRPVSCLWAKLTWSVEQVRHQRPSLDGRNNCPRIMILGACGSYQARGPRRELPNFRRFLADQQEGAPWGSKFSGTPLGIWLHNLISLVVKTGCRVSQVQAWARVSETPEHTPGETVSLENMGK